jgi:hypothetical protein
LPKANKKKKDEIRKKKEEKRTMALMTQDANVVD